ncbi:MAG: zinc ribbon domain-containing protein [Clostridia bacterium]|nr:zinc ribbon domain-containing protein [Clostridia bacterium]
MMAYAGPQAFGPIKTAQPSGMFMGMMTEPPKTVKYCENCGAQMPLTAKFCGKCGSRFDPSAFCPGCGAKRLPGAKFCTECGAVLE